jgi:uncharacterized cupin superfamily protein
MVLPDVGPVSVPIGEPIAHLKCFEAVVLKDEKIEAGVWECSPGIWRRQVLQAELCHFVTGHAFFTPEGGDKFEIKVEPGTVLSSEFASRRPKDAGVQIHVRSSRRRAHQRHIVKRCEQYAAIQRIEMQEAL